MYNEFDVGNDINEAYCDGFEAGVKSAKPRWIPVTERLPFAEYGESDDVLTVNSLGVMRVANWDGGNWKHPNGNLISSIVIFPITHWMPLPSTEGLT